MVRLVKALSMSHAASMHLADTLFREIGILCLKDLGASCAHRRGVRRSELCIRTQMPKLSYSFEVTTRCLLPLSPALSPFSYVSVAMYIEELDGLEIFQFVAILPPLVLIHQTTHWPQRDGCFLKYLSTLDYPVL